MKHKLNRIIKELIKYFNKYENNFSVNEISIYFSVFISAFSLHSRKMQACTCNIYDKDISKELLIIKERFPDYINTYKKINDFIDLSTKSKIFLSIKDVFKDANEDIDDLTSWSYQFLKKDLEKIAFKKIGKNNNKIEDSELLYTTQFFTDKYMVKYLVDRVLADFNNSNIKKLVIIDPASGGGNFLNYAFECLYNLYKKREEDWSNQKIVDTILNEALIGYDLDFNLAKIASLSLFVKACTYTVPSKTTSIKIYGGVGNDKLGYLKPDVISNSINEITFNSQLKRINNNGKIQVFVTNPPFMGKRDMETTLKNSLLKLYPESKGDLCASFIQRIIQSMNEKDILGIVAQNNWMYLSSLRNFRKLFLKQQKLKECIDLGSNAFVDINGEKTNVALFVIGKSSQETTKFYNLKFKQLTEKKSFVSDKYFPSELTFELNQSLFVKNQNYELNYQLMHWFDKIQRLQKYSNFAKPMQGTSTGNNTKFVKYVWEVNGDQNWRLVSKGGGFSKWIGLNYYKVLWGDNAEFIKANKGSALRNISKITETQLVYSDTGTLGLNVRMLKTNQVFIASGPGITVYKGDKYAHIAFLNSRLVTFLLKIINPKFTISAGYISKIPVADNILNSKSIIKKSKECIKLKEIYLQRKLPNIEFRHVDYSVIKNIEQYIEQVILDDFENDYKRILLESEIESEINNRFMFNTAELKDIKRVVGESPFFNINKVIEVDSKQIDLLITKSIDLNCFSTSRAINGYSIGSESVLEDLSYKLNVHPDSIYDFIQTNISCFKNTKKKYYNDLLHKIILNELGVRNVSSYQLKIFDFKNIISSLKSKYTFLKGKVNLEKSIISILQGHHKKSFFNRPLIKYSDEAVIVGKENRG